MAHDGGSGGNHRAESGKVAPHIFSLGRMSGLAQDRTAANLTRETKF